MERGRRRGALSVAQPLAEVRSCSMGIFRNSYVINQRRLVAPLSVHCILSISESGSSHPLH